MDNNHDKRVGYVSDKIAILWGIPEQKDKPIIQSKNWLNEHGSKHKYEFKCEYNFNQAIKRIPEIIKNPDYVSHNKKQHGLEYFKKLEERVTLIVGITGKKKLYLKTIYPSSKSKQKSREEKEILQLEPGLLDKYTYKGSNNN